MAKTGGDSEDVFGFRRQGHAREEEKGRNNKKEGKT